MWSVSAKASTNRPPWHTALCAHTKSRRAKAVVPSQTKSHTCCRYERKEAINEPHNRLRPKLTVNWIGKNLLLLPHQNGRVGRRRSLYGMWFACKAPGSHRFWGVPGSWAAPPSILPAAKPKPATSSAPLNKKKKRLICYTISPLLL